MHLRTVYIVSLLVCFVACSGGDVSKGGGPSTGAGTVGGGGLSTTTGSAADSSGEGTLGATDGGTSTATGGISAAGSTKGSSVGGVSTTTSAGISTTTSAGGTLSSNSAGGASNASSAGGASTATSGDASTSSNSTGGTAGTALSDGSDGDYYVAVDGDDSNPGTIEQPFATMQRAIEAAGPGDLVYVRGGTYEIVQGANAGAGIAFSKSGNSDTDRIRYFAYPGEHPVFDFAQLRIQPDPNYTSGVVVSGAWLHLKGFEIRNVPMNTRSNTGLSVNGDAHDDIFELLDVHHNFGSGMFIHTTTGGHQIINCDSHDNYDPYSHQGDGQNADGFGVHYQKMGKVTSFRGCRAWWNSDDGWDFISQEVPVIVENSWAMGNGYINSGTGRPADGNGNGFKAGSSKTGIRHVVKNCVAWGNRASGFYANHSSGGNDWFNNTSYDNGTQYNMLASTWDADGNRTDGVILTGDMVHRMRNNIGFPNDNANMQGVDSEFNSWDLGLTPTDNDFVSVSDAGFMGPRNPDGSLPVLDFMKLRDGSQLIDKGTDVGTPFDGSAPDLGAYEH